MADARIKVTLQCSNQMTVEDCIADVEAEEATRAEAFKEKLAYWRGGGGVPLVLPDSFRAAR